MPRRVSTSLDVISFCPSLAWYGLVVGASRVLYQMRNTRSPGFRSISDAPGVVHGELEAPFEAGIHVEPGDVNEAPKLPLCLH